jgi:hypothetical protein
VQNFGVRAFIITFEPFGKKSGQPRGSRELDFIATEFFRILRERNVVAKLFNSRKLLHLPRYFAHSQQPLSSFSTEYGKNNAL